MSLAMSMGEEAFVEDGWMLGDFGDLGEGNIVFDKFTLHRCLSAINHR